MGSCSKTLTITLVQWYLLSGGVSIVLEMMVLGMKGAALAALGEMAGGFFPAAPAAFAVAPLGERKDGVKLGESTLSDFLTCGLLFDQHSVDSITEPSNLSLSAGLAPFATGDLKSETLWL